MYINIKYLTAGFLISSALASTSTLQADHDKLLLAIQTLKPEQISAYSSAVSSQAMSLLANPTFVSLQYAADMHTAVDSAIRPWRNWDYVRHDPIKPTMNPADYVRLPPKWRDPIKSIMDNFSSENIAAYKSIIMPPPRPTLSFILSWPSPDKAKPRE